MSFRIWGGVLTTISVVVVKVVVTGARIVVVHIFVLVFFIYSKVISLLVFTVFDAPLSLVYFVLACFQTLFGFTSFSCYVVMGLSRGGN